MHGLELKPLSIEALAALRDDVIALLAERVAAKQRELEGEIARINGLNGSAPAKQVKAKSAAKYRGPEGQEWSGRGSRPKWVADELAKGRTLEDLKA